MSSSLILVLLRMIQRYRTWTGEGAEHSRARKNRQPEQGGPGQTTLRKEVVRETAAVSC